MKLLASLLLILSSLPAVTLGGYIFRPETFKDEDSRSPFKDEDYRSLSSQVCDLKDPNPKIDFGPLLFDGKENPMVCDFPVRFSCCIRKGPYDYDFPLTSLKCDTEKDSFECADVALNEKGNGYDCVYENIDTGKAYFDNGTAYEFDLTTFFNEDVAVAQIGKNYIFILAYDGDIVEREGIIKDGRGAYVIKRGFVEIKPTPFTTMSTVVDYCGKVIDVCKKLGKKQQKKQKQQKQQKS
jgi:hypothetical protein